MNVQWLDDREWINGRIMNIQHIPPHGICAHFSGIRQWYSHSLSGIHQGYALTSLSSVLHTSLLSFNLQSAATLPTSILHSSSILHTSFQSSSTSPYIHPITSQLSPFIHFSFIHYPVSIHASNHQPLSYDHPALHPFSVHFDAFLSGSRNKRQTQGGQTGLPLYGDPQLKNTEAAHPP